MQWGHSTKMWSAQVYLSSLQQFSFTIVLCFGASKIAVIKIDIIIRILQRLRARGRSRYWGLR
jgi:hypothetical protein